jgi:IS66 C-terminal element
MIAQRANCVGRFVNSIYDLGYSKAWLFAGSDRGGERAAVMLTLIQTAKLNDVDPQAWLAEVLARIADHKINDLAALLPGNWRLGSDDLDTSIRHVTIPMNSHMTHTLNRSTSRPPTDGYAQISFLEKQHLRAPASLGTVLPLVLHK